MSSNFLPDREGKLVTWSTNFDTLITANPAIYGLDLGQVVSYAALHAAFIGAYQTANDPSTRTPSSIVSKNDAKDALIASARDLVGIVQNFPGITDVLRSDLGITVPNTEPTPIPPPSDPPGIDIVSAVARTVRVRVHDVNSPTIRGKPDGVAGAAVFSYVGATAPVELDDWQFEGNTTRTSVDVEFDPEVANGATVWLTAFWFNPRTQSGPAAQPVSTNIPGGLSLAA